MSRLFHGSIGCLNNKRGSFDFTVSCFRTDGLIVTINRVMILLQVSYYEPTAVRVASNVRNPIFIE